MPEKISPSILTNNVRTMGRKGGLAKPVFISLQVSPLSRERKTPSPLFAANTCPELLKAIQIVDAWENPVSGDQHVFAILARNKTIIALNQKIARLDGNTRSIINSTIISNDKLEKIALAHQALDTQIERFAYQQVLSKIYPTGQPVQQVWQISKLNNDFKKLLGRIRIKPDISIANDESNKIEQALVEGLKQSGITVDFSRSADFILHATLALDDYNKLIDKIGRASCRERV